MVKRVLFCFYAIPLHYNHGVALLSRLCKDRGIEVDLLILDNLPGFQRQITQNQYDLVCFSVSILKDFNLCESYIELSLLHGQKTALGGTFFRRNNPSIFDGRTLICRGEGELLPEYILNGDETIFRSRYLCPDIATLPLPDYSIGMVYDGDIPQFKPRTMLPYYSSRGCVGECSFCDVRHQNGDMIRIRRKVEQDLEWLTAIYKPEMVFMGDETIPYHDGEWRRSWGDFRYPFYCYIRADIPEETLLWLIDRGMVGCAFGVESGNEQYRNEVLKKNLTDEQIFRTAGILDKHNLHYVHFYMTGTKGETFEIMRETELFTKKMGGKAILFNYTDVVHSTKES
jgi:anaerobic magnesium-protoporphyrin IX monomethyl ester cyclase